MLFRKEIASVDILGTKIPQLTHLFDFLGFEKHVKQYRDKRGKSIPDLWYDHASYYVIDLPEDKLFGPDDVVTIPPCTKMADYEFEIALIVTKHALLKSEKEAIAFIKENCFVTIMNDWSSRDVQMKDMEGLGPTNSKLIIGKSIGPRLVPASELNLDDNGVFDFPMRLRVNGEERCNSNFQSLYHTHPKTGKRAAWSFPRLFKFMGDHNIAVQPGYLIGSGTVGDGCIGEFSAKIDPSTGAVLSPARYEWLKDGDTIELDAEGIGTLRNTIRLA
jgi:2-keto-4-pentenoate hydratase/2-oxohepta-3-ene-1,7-dioic acid hydratase in catechol pathway